LEFRRVLFRSVAALGGDGLNGANGFDYAGEHATSRSKQETRCMRRTPVFSWQKLGVADRRGNGRTNDARQGIPLSLIRTVTVGSGISPDLLTLPKATGARGLGPCRPSPPVGSSTPP